MAANTAGTANTDGRSALSDLQVIAGLLAGLAALVYLTGGAALGLRLLWAGLPTLPVGQLPRDFLFSLGAAQIVLPAVVLGVVAGMLELGQSLRGLKYGHRPWSAVKMVPKLRNAYLAFYGTIPLLLIAPGAVIALATDDDLDATATSIAITCVGVAAAVALVVWVGFVRAVKLDDRKDKQNRQAGNVDGWIWVAVLAPALVFWAAIGLWIRSETHSARYFALIGAWVAALLFALLTVWVRSQAGDVARRHSPLGEGDNVGIASEPKDETIEVPPWVIVMSWAGTALLAVPALIVVVAAWPLSDAAVCAQQAGNTSYVAAGKFVGDTKDRVFIGDVGNDRLISVATRGVSRVLVGRHEVGTSACATYSDG